jgi:hypothetical protein
MYRFNRELRPVEARLQSSRTWVNLAVDRAQRSQMEERQLQVLAEFVAGIAARGEI